MTCDYVTGVVSLQAVIKSDDFTCWYFTSSIFSDAIVTTSPVWYLYSQGGADLQVLSALSGRNSADSVKSCWYFINDYKVKDKSLSYSAGLVLVN